MTEAQKNLRQHNIAIGELLSGANAEAKKVLRKYRPDVSHAANFKAVKSLNNPLLEKCAEYIKLKVRSTDTQDQFYSNKEVLVDRIILKIESYLPDTCDECESKYCNKVDDDTPPLLVCFICSQGSHNCEKMKEKHDKFRMCLEDPNPLLGLHWL